MPYRLAVLPLAALALAGCSVAMAAHRQSFKCDPSILQPGADRQVIESACGPPDLLTSLDAGKTKAIYKIDPNAVNGGTKGVEVAGDVVGDVLTFGLWEIVATPIELGSEDKITNFIITYGADQKIVAIETVK